MGMGTGHDKVSVSLQLVKQGPECTDAFMRGGKFLHGDSSHSITEFLDRRLVEIKPPRSKGGRKCLGSLSGDGRDEGAKGRDVILCASSSLFIIVGKVYVLPVVRA